MQIWRPPTTLSIRYTASSSDRLAVLAVDLINSTCTYYNIVNKCILITANKRIHIISAYFLAAASDKRMRLLTSLYGTSFQREAIIAAAVTYQAYKVCIL